MKRRRITRSRAATTGELMPPAKTGMARKCCVRSCEADVQEARARGLPLHKFPKDPALRSKWLSSGGFDPNFKPTSGQVVCHKHFKRADYEAATKGNKLILRKGSVPSVFADYDNHPDPVIMSVKSSISYAQEDLDLINSEIMNMGQSASPSLSDVRTPKSDSCGEQIYSRPVSSVESTNTLDQADSGETDNKLLEHTEESVTRVKLDLENEEIKVNSMAVQLGIMEPQGDLENVSQDLIIKENLKDCKVSEDKKFDNSDDLKPKIANAGTFKFCPGAKLEAKDFNDKWYTAKIVETDWEEREVLIHFDKWSSRFDEWIPMDSSRLRTCQEHTNEQDWEQPSCDTKVKGFSVGERILATWADGRKYPAKVNAVLDNDRYDVLFDDGYSKVVKSSKMTKIVATPSKEESSPGDNYIGSKQERRDKKRKHTIMELFHTHSRKRTKPENEKSVNKKEDPLIGETSEYLAENKVELDGTLFGPCYDPGTDLLKGFDTNVSKMKTHKKNKKDLHKSDLDQEDDVGPEWIDGEPQGIESYIVDGNDGPRRSIIVPDKRLPAGWQKHFTQRKAGTSAGKWDVLFTHKSTGKKFRSKNDIKAFMENQGLFDFDPEKFDFCIHRRKKSISKIKPEVAFEAPKKIKTLLPRAKVAPSTETTLLPSTNSIAPSIVVPTLVSPITDGAVFIGGLRVEMEDSAYKCPKEGCNKNFRKENLLQMHIKHYHPEYSKFLGSTPNVADLAYARTIGESIEDVIPKKSQFLDKVNKTGKKKLFPERLPTGSLNLLQPVSPSLPTNILADNEDDGIHSQKCSASEMLKEDSLREAMSPISNHSLETEEEIEKKRENKCAMSPGTLFDLKTREEKTQGGIKTLLPVRHTTEAQKLDRNKVSDEMAHIERTKSQRKRPTDSIAEPLLRGKKRHAIQDLMEEYGDMDESAVDAEGPTIPMYRYSRRKSDSKSDENSQNSQLTDSRPEKCDVLKGDTVKRDNNVDTEEEGVMMMINGEMVKVEKLRREEIINCTCGFMEEDGLMIQCDLCLCWQHGHCNAIERERDVPEKYVCYICKNPFRQRPSKKYYHDQDWIKEGKLSSLPNRTKNQNTINRRTATLKRSFDLVSDLLQLQEILHSLRVKINVANKKDHPKLYLWAKNWNKIPIPKPNIEPIPVIEIIKPATEMPEVTTEIFPNSDVKLESKLSNTKEDYDEKSIASDSELMKILEEDSTPSDEAKTAIKDETVDKNKTHILLDALTRNDTNDEKNDTEVLPKIEPGDTDLDSNQLLQGENPITTSTTTVMNEQEQNNLPEVKNEITAPPLQPIIPEPEAPIDPQECRMRLLEHIEHYQCHVDTMLTNIEAQIDVLENMDSDNLPSEGDQARIKQTIQMLLRDLSTARVLASLS